MYVCMYVRTKQLYSYLHIKNYCSYVLEYVAKGILQRTLIFLLIKTVEMLQNFPAISRFSKGQGSKFLHFTYIFTNSSSMMCIQALLSCYILLYATKMPLL